MENTEMKHTFRTKICSLTLGSMTAFSVMADKPAAADVNPFIGEIMLIGATFCPRNWVDADGGPLAVADYTALFSLYGTMYGGDGRTTFGIPDLRGRVAIGAGQGPGLATYKQGVEGGTDNFTISTNSMPSGHNHEVLATNLEANKSTPGGAILGIHDPFSNNFDMYHEGPPDIKMASGMIADTGTSEAVTKRSPYQVIRWCIATEGTYPSKP
jgi:microcystin-dependent protein